MVLWVPWGLVLVLVLGCRVQGEGWLLCRGVERWQHCYCYYCYCWPLQPYRPPLPYCLAAPAGCLAPVRLAGGRGSPSRCLTQNTQRLTGSRQAGYCHPRPCPHHC